ncbi:MAG: gltK [Acidimicrobiales bacterium]|nr:gltK [Acidimicrobiales bacterium]
MTAPVLADTLGPRGRRRVLVATIASAVVIAAVVAVAVLRLVDKGQLDWVKWRPFTRWAGGDTLADAGVIRFLLGGLTNTLKAAGAAMALALLVGGLMALARLSRNHALRWPARGYVEFFRGVPLLLLILFSAHGLPKAGLHLSLFWYLVLALAAYNSAVLAEIFRSGILSLDRGQSEAAFALGLGYWQAMLTVIVPQALRRMVPAIVSQLVTLLKDTSLGFVIAFDELLGRSRSTGEFLGNPLQTVTVAALIYITVNLTLSRVVRRLELRQRHRYRAGAISVAGVEDLTVVGAQADTAATRMPGGPGPRRR